MRDEFNSFLSVTDLTIGIKKLLESSYSTVNVKGEISNFKHHSSGHMYFTLKDEQSEIKCVIFKGSNQNLDFRPDNGMEIILKGRISLYEPRGQYQIIASQIKQAGIGELFIEFESLKKKLAQNGFFDKGLKKKLPAYPQKIALITSPTGAALQDMLNVFNRRAKHVELVLRPALVQGDDAVFDIIDAINEMKNLSNIDIIILARGGGSIEDLWSFNHEKLAKVIFECDTPIVSAIGHETDTTISDMVADLRAPTPSAAAEMVVRSTNRLVEDVQGLITKIAHIVQIRLDSSWQNFDYLKDRHSSLNPSKVIIDKIDKINNLSKSLILNMNHSILLTKSNLEKNHQNLLSLSPKKILKRGYSIAFDEDGKIIKRGDQIHRGDKFLLKTGNGSFYANKSDQ